MARVCWRRHGDGRLRPTTARPSMSGWRKRCGTKNRTHAIEFVGCSTPIDDDGAVTAAPQPLPHSLEDQEKLASVTSRIDGIEMAHCGAARAPVPAARQDRLSDEVNKTAMFESRDDEGSVAKPWPVSKPVALALRDDVIDAPQRFTTRRD